MNNKNCDNNSTFLDAPHILVYGELHINTNFHAQAPSGAGKSKQALTVEEI